MIAMATDYKGFGHFLSERRQDIGSDQERIAELMGRSQQHVSRIERGLVGLAEQPDQVLLGLIWGYRLGQGDIERWELEIPKRVLDEAFPSEDSFDVPEDFELVPLAGVSNGGRIIDPESHYAVVPKGRRRPGSKLYKVEGNSMVDPDEPFAEHSIHSGDHVWVDTAQTEPVHGQVFVLQLQGNGYVTKKLEVLDGVWYLRSYNEAISPASKLDFDEARIMGMVYQLVPGERKYKPK